MQASLRRTLDNPFQALRDFDRVVNRMWDTVEEGVGTTSFPVDIREVDDTLTVEAELPGFAKDQIDVSVEQGVLNIEAQRPAREAKAEVKVHLSERRATHYARRFTLPTAYDTNNVEASLVDGVLTLTLAKREESKPKKIEVK
ncbi:Hsp20/alpha crystallin family protein [Algisphaera agarilytica]|uniref:HSP20 family protein n=1 Tax=Algisphaera agarilytica TaxID=1385975 RepID=A0A7X0H3X9_9BACT|nr:Hsp20/alpha crystallin family protein [Algisphaera agarilytica]MBB6428749.1 HSP20 family protein [Algisphaera agarilytica]